MIYASGERQLEELLRDVEVSERIGETLRAVQGLTADSRAVKPGYLFVAVRGNQVDGHDFIESAVANGARVVMVSAGRLDGLTVHPEVLYLEVLDTSQAYGVLCGHFYGDPSHRLKLVGVTGTNGKTTVVRLLHRLSLALGHRAGVISTTGCWVNQEKVMMEGHMTTPDALVIHALLRRMVDAGCQYAFMEVSSHSMVQHRVEGLRFAGGVFTNLTSDHLDYHETWRNYRDAKKLFFDMLPKGSFMLYNAEDENGRYMAQNTAATVRTFSTTLGADHWVQLQQEIPGGMELLLPGGERVWVGMNGKFNVPNLAAVFAVAEELGFDPEQLPRALSSLGPVEGRFEMHQGPEGRLGIVDFAHTPSALAALLDSVRRISPKGARVITVFGAGGDRDASKRKDMGEVVSKRSDWAVITNDNPRSEDPQGIMHSIYMGVPSEREFKLLFEPDRREAIRAACMLSRPHDIVVVAGKGHEKTQIFADREEEFDDAKELDAAFALLIAEGGVERLNAGVDEGSLAKNSQGRGE